VNTRTFYNANAFHIGSLSLLEQTLTSRNIDILYIDGRSITDKASLWARIVVDLKGAETMQPQGWDGFNDVLWQGLAAHKADRVALIWTHAERMIEPSFNDFLVAMIVFADIIRAVQTTRHGFPQAMHLQLFLMGEGQMFPQLEYWLD
jgi:hypothetical protein